MEDVADGVGHESGKRPVEIEGPLAAARAELSGERFSAVGA
jgi:hypothetical protein